MEIKVYNPNVSVVMPVGCNAKCKFCEWKKNEGLDLEKFKFYCDNLPDDIFKQVCITGGEPTMMIDLDEYLIVARERFEKVVLNTNGYMLTEDNVKLVDHVNISRHHYDDDVNYEIFGTQSVPSYSELKDICKLGDVTLNCWLPKGFDDKGFIEEYVAFAKELGAKVAFRIDFENELNVIPVDKEEDVVYEHSCPACLHRDHIINEVEVKYKYGVVETHTKVDGIYELIIQPNGDLTVDWGGTIKLEYEEDEC